MQPKCLCSICSKDVRITFVYCSSCKCKVHFTCSGLTRAQFSNVNEQDVWYCETCIRNVFPFSLLTNEELEWCNNAIDEHNTTYYELSKEFNYHPFQYSEKKFLLNDGNVDPDNNFFNDITFKCKYYNELDFNTDHCNNNTTETFSILYINVRSIKKNSIAQLCKVIKLSI